MVYTHMESELPNVSELKTTQYPVPLTVYSDDGVLLAQFGDHITAPVTIDQVPQMLISAFLAAEDDRFFDHPGVDYLALLRSLRTLVVTGEKREGGSTITMQVARNFFLSSEKTFRRKFKEIFLAFKIERELTKREILELYLNKIYFGHRTYGIEAAAQYYFGKALPALDVSECAVLASLPKAPSRGNPVTDPERAARRRNYVLERMRKLQFITAAQYQQALAQPIPDVPAKPLLRHSSAPYVAEMVREQMVQWYGDDAYAGGFRVYTTIDTRLQAHAEQSLREGLQRFERATSGSRAAGKIPVNQLSDEAAVETALRTYAHPDGVQPGVVVEVTRHYVTVFLNQHQQVKLATRQPGSTPEVPRERVAKRRFAVGDVIYVAPQGDTYGVVQVPKVDGALVSLRASDGAILALVGGYDFAKSKFNRAVQAKRQAGSGFKPLIYTAAMENGFSPSSVVLDAPFVISDPSAENGEWRPANYSGRFYGPTRLRVALAHSRNLVTVRLASQLGLRKVIEVAERFGLAAAQLPHGLSLALGTAEVSPLDMAKVYAVFANGGFRVEPFLIKRIERDNGQAIYQAAPPTACPQCSPDEAANLHAAPRIIAANTHYWLYSMLQDVIRQGTATRALALGRSDLAGKTGTTNDYRDAWFNGFAPGLVAVCWVGYDSNQSLGRGRTGSEVALPIWMDYMRSALQGYPDHPFIAPDKVFAKFLDPRTGLETQPTADGSVAEYFVPNDADGVSITSTSGVTAPTERPRDRRSPTRAPSSGSTIQDLF